IQGQNSAVDSADWLGYDEAGNASPRIFTCRACRSRRFGRKLGYQGDGMAAGNEPAEFHLGVGNSWGKTQLIDLPQTIEIGGAKIANPECQALALRQGFQPFAPLSS